MTRSEIEAILPHRDPFLLIDEILELDESRVVAVKNVTGEEYFFKGHFPGYPIMPGVLIIEALAQAGAVAILQRPENKGKIGFLTGVDGAKFRKKVFPGDRLILTVEIENFKMGIGRGKAMATVNGLLAAEAVIKFAVAEPD